MSNCVIDHLAVVAPSLDAGAAFVRNVLGVTPQAGGEHPRMGTHNLLLRLGQSQFLEVIAPNPAATAPTRPRWFGLDALTADAAPALAVWVARTNDLQACVAAATEPLGAIEPMSRGALQWLITIPADGSLPLSGAAPVLIPWHTDTPPATRLPDVGLSLARLELSHAEPQRISSLLTSLGMDTTQLRIHAAPRGSRSKLVALIQTPHGLRRLSMPVAENKGQGAVNR